MTSITTTIRAVTPADPDQPDIPAWQIRTDHGVHLTAPAAAYVIHPGLIGQRMTLHVDRARRVYAIADPAHDREPATIR